MRPSLLNSLVLLSGLSLLACSASQPQSASAGAAKAPSGSLVAPAATERPNLPSQARGHTPDVVGGAPGTTSGVDGATSGGRKAAPSSPLSGAAPEPGASTRAEGALRQTPHGTPSAERRFREEVVSASETRAVVLLYHGFDRGKDPLSVSSRHFREQMVWLREHQVEVVWPSELVQFLRGELELPRRVAVITIDDGMASVYSKAWPILRELSVPFSLGITTALVEEKHREAMRWEQIEEMLSSGLVEIASHGHRHRGLANISERLVDEELERSRAILEARLGVTPRVYYYPLGSMNARVRERALTRGYEAAFTATGAPIALGSAHLGAIPRTSVFYGDTLGQFGWFFRGFLDRVKPSQAQARQPSAG